MNNPTILIPDRPASDCRPQTLISPQSGGLQKHLRRHVSVSFDQNGDFSTLELEVQDIGGSAWAILGLDGKTLASFLIFPSPPCSETDLGLGSFGLPGGDWLRNMSTATGLEYDEHQWYRDAASDVLEAPFHRGIDLFQLLVRRVSRGEPSTPHSAPGCSYMVFVRQNNRITTTYIIE
jgi:hypothetical protein